GDEGKVNAYGSTEKSVMVTQPVVLHATLPRVVGPGEEVALPVNVFVSDASIKNVTIEVEANDVFTVVDQTAALTFDAAAGAIANLRMKVNDHIGQGHVRVTERSGKELAAQDIFIASRPADPPSVICESKSLPPGEV